MVLFLVLILAESLVDKAVQLNHIGGFYGVMKPCDFICLTLKLLEINPEREIILAYIEQEHFKYLRALGAFYLRLTARAKDVYNILEPFLLDKRKLRFRSKDGFSLTFMDEFIDQLLTEERVCETLLPKMIARNVLEETGELEPRVSILEDELDNEVSESEELKDEPIEESKPVKPFAVSSKKVEKLFKQKPLTESIVKEQSNGKDSDSLSIEETNKLRLSLGLKPLK